MNVKLSTVLALLIVGAFPALSLYAASTPSVGLSEEEMAVKTALLFIRNGPTYMFDGIAGTLIVIKTVVLESFPLQYVVTICFDSRHAGYGDRTGQVLAQVITHHTAVVKVVNNRVVSAVLDGKWDELNQREITPSGEKPKILSPESAKDTAINYVRLVHDEVKNVKPPSSWQTTNLTPQGLVGASKLRFTAEGWTVNISWAVVREPTYTIEIMYYGEHGFIWKGTVDPAGAVKETEFKLLS